MLFGLDRLRLCENGVVSLNLPLASQVVGARASRTTHPRVLAGFNRLLSHVADRPFTVENPFIWKTKTDIIRLLQETKCLDLIALTRSCANPRQSSNRQPHCGVCSQCIDRRFAILAAGQEEYDPAESYHVDLLKGGREAGRDQMMAALYTELARQITKMNRNAFFGRFGESARALTAFDETPEVIAQKIYQLVRRHSEQVSEVIRTGISRYSDLIYDRSLPATCLLRMIAAPGEEELEEVVRAEGAKPLSKNLFKRKGEKSFEVRFNGGKDFLLEVSLGGAYLHILLSNPGRSFTPSELICLVRKHAVQYSLGHAGDKITEETRREYQARAEEILEELEEAKDCQNVERQGELREELEWIEEELRTSKTRRGLPRKEKDQPEKNRKSVTNAIKRALDRIRDFDGALVAHLVEPILTRGSNLKYAEDTGMEWDTESSPDESS